MQITNTARAGEFEVKLKGRMDASWSDHVARALAEAVRSGQHAISVDMAEVNYISSAGIRILVLYARQLDSIQGSLSIVNASKPVLRILELSGLESLLRRAASAPPAQAREAVPTSVELVEPGATAELFELQREAALRVHWPGDPEQFLGGASDPEAGSIVEFPVEAIGIGLGGFADGGTGGKPCYGEFLAAAGAVVCLPTDSSHQPDYVLQRGHSLPPLKVAYGMVGSGGFRHLLRFDKGPQEPSLPFSSIVRAGLQANGGNAAGFVMVAETASLTGVSVRKLPSSSETPGAASSLFAFPAVRDWLSFTAEPAFPHTTSLIVGFAARQADARRLNLLKPLAPSGEVQGHFHAAAFPYQPLRKGKVNPSQTVRPLFDSGQVLGVLHLLNDWREINGIGESRLMRGACWCSPLLVQD